MSQLEVDKIVPQSGTTLTIGDSGDTINFADGTSIGIDTDTLYIDSTNNRVGIGLTNPAYKLDIFGYQPSINLKDSSNATNQCTVLSTAGANQASLTLSRSGVNQSSAQLNALGNFANLTLSSLGNTASVIEATGNQLTFNVNGSERMRINASGNLLVGTTEAPATVATTSSVEGLGYQANDYLAISRAGTSEQGNLILNKLTNDGDIIVLNKNGTRVGSIFSRSGVVSGIILDPRAGGNGLLGQAGAIIPVDETQTREDNATDLGNSTYRYKDLYLGGGLYVGGTASANKLDDYEEGSWSPTLGSGTATVDKAGYIKIGNKVTVWTNMNNFSDRSSGGNVEITNLPFTANTTYDASAVGSCLWSYVDSSECTTTYLTPSSTLNFYGAHSAGFSALKYNQLNNSASNLYLTATYYTQ
jgi:hypothetical protein